MGELRFLEGGFDPDVDGLHLEVIFEGCLVEEVFDGGLEIVL